MSFSLAGRVTELRLLGPSGADREVGEIASGRGERSRMNCGYCPMIFLETT